MQIGRITGLAEPQGFSQPDMSTVSFGLLASATQAKQLLDLGSNGAERFVPIIFGTALAANDGVYELLEVGVEGDPNLEAAGLRQVSVSARCENQGRQVANAQLLVRGDSRERTVAVGVTGPLYQVAVPDPATTVTAFNAGPAGFNVAASALPTLRGDVRRLVDATKVKVLVNRATTANITLSGTVSVDGANAANLTRVLVKNQTTKSENGIYVVNTGGAWTRAVDADGGDELDFAQVAINVGTVNGGTTWFNPNRLTIGVTAYDWQQAPAFGLRESDRGGPVSIAYRVPLANWYGGACTVEQGGTVVTGNRLASSGAVTADNGLIRVGFTTAGFEMEMAAGSPLAWKMKKAISFSLESEVSPSIITNTPDQVVIRNRIISTTYPKYRGSLDLAIIRGSRTVTASVSFQNSLQAFIDLPGASTLLSVVAGTPGYASTGLDHLDYEDADDADGNRTGFSSAAELDNFVAVPGESPSGHGTTSSVRAVSFGVHAVVGGGNTLTGADKLYEMDRAWFAMIAQQTSAGVV